MGERILSLPGFFWMNGNKESKAILVEGKIHGTQFYLRSVGEADAFDRWWQWFNDPIVTQNMNKGLE